MTGQHIPADHSRGDANTIGGYASVHGRPAAFEGSDGLSYSVEILAEPVAAGAGNAGSRYGAWLLFVQWGRIGGTSPSGHLESDFLAEADTEGDARAFVGALSLLQVRGLLHELIAERTGGAPQRRWWDAMRNDAGGDPS